MYVPEIRQIQKLIWSQDPKASVEANIRMLALYNYGWRISSLAWVLGLSDRAIRTRLDNARRIGTTNPPRGTPGYVSPLKYEEPDVTVLDDDAAEMRRLYLIMKAGEPSRRRPYEEYEQWFNAKWTLAKCMWKLHDAGMRKRDIAAIVGCTTQFVQARVIDWSISEGIRPINR